MENPFSERMAVLPDIELFKILQQEKEYEHLAVEAAKNEIEKRELTNEERKVILRKLAEEEQKKEEKRLVIVDAITKLSELIKNLFILIPTNTKSPSLYINILGILLIAKAITSLGFEIYFWFILGFDTFTLPLVLPTVLFAFFLIGIAIALFKKKKFGWIMLTLFFIILFSRNCLVLYVSWFVDYTDPEGFNTALGFSYYMATLIVPIIIAVYLNNQKVLQLFKISKIYQKVTLFISFTVSLFYFIFWVNAGY